MKIATMSKVFRTLERMPPAIRSERKTSPLLSAIVAIESVTSKKLSSSGFTPYTLDTTEFTPARSIHVDVSNQH